MTRNASSFTRETGTFRIAAAMNEAERQRRAFQADGALHILRALLSAMTLNRRAASKAASA